MQVFCSPSAFPRLSLTRNGISLMMTRKKDRLMRKKWFFRRIALFVCLAALAAGCRPERNPLPVVQGTNIQIDAGSHHIEGTLETFEKHHFLLKDEGKSIGVFSGDAFVTMIPLQTAQELRTRYGDFFSCNNPGAAQAMHAARAAILVADSREAQQSIAKAMAQVRKGRVPAISFSGGPLQIHRQTYRGISVSNDTGIPIYYTRQFQIIDPDFSHSK